MDNQPSIYEIYVLENPITIDKFGQPQWGRRESVGFYYELETAKRAVKDNWTDINEKGAYNAAIIVKKAPGLYPITLIQGYYVFNQKTEKYDNKEVPKEMENYNLG